ncbi:hypothetical protein BOX15_Mlig019952g1 [Macrostomum lignano]|uniref:RETREG1-3/ARL6IP-like N-terminal reticulon-homology domain-containing protein n=1 Tax=Macrostomum lignano TaxID=282301 RepID=A0A267GN99_9PLAT|nr:hypothetical protein BOX15_Mlig019952g1 [Macrostomum lignano]
MQTNSVSFPSEEDRAAALAKSLHGWRVPIVRLDAILHWEQPPALGGIIAGITLAFLLIGWLQPPLVSMLAIVGLLLLIADFVVPLAASWLLSSGVAGIAWTEADDRRYRDTCARLVGVWDSVSGLASQMLTLRRDRPQFYLAIALPALLSLLVLAEKINNLFLAYLIIVSGLLLPGLLGSGVAASAARKLYELIRARVQALQQRSAGSKEPKAE